MRSDEVVYRDLTFISNRVGGTHPPVDVNPKRTFLNAAGYIGFAPEERDNLMASQAYVCRPSCANASEITAAI